MKKAWGKRTMLPASTHLAARHWVAGRAEGIFYATVSLCVKTSGRLRLLWHTRWSAALHMIMTALDLQWDTALKMAVSRGFFFHQDLRPLWTGNVTRQGHENTKYLRGTFQNHSHCAGMMMNDGFREHLNSNLLQWGIPVGLKQTAVCNVKEYKGQQQQQKYTVHFMNQYWFFYVSKKILTINSSDILS